MKPATNLKQATALLGHYAQVDAQIAGIEAKRKRVIALVNTIADRDVTRLNGELEKLAERLQPWWDANKADHAGKNKSAQISGCTIGYRSARAKLAHAYADDAAAVAALKATRLYKQTTRPKVDLDRTAIVKLLKAAGKTAQTLLGLGFRVDQSDSFFVERTDPASTVAK